MFSQTKLGINASAYTVAKSIAAASLKSQSKNTCKNLLIDAFVFLKPLEKIFGHFTGNFFWQKLWILHLPT